MPTTIDTNTLLDILHDIYRFAGGVILDAANEGTTIEAKARGLMPQKFAHEFFACLQRCRTEKSRTKELTLLASICQALAYESARRQLFDDLIVGITRDSTKNERNQP